MCSSHPLIWVDDSISIYKWKSPKNEKRNREKALLWWCGYEEDEDVEEEEEIGGYGMYTEGHGWPSSY